MKLDFHHNKNQEEKTLRISKNLHFVAFLAHLFEIIYFSGGWRFSDICKTNPEIKLLCMLHVTICHNMTEHKHCALFWLWDWHLHIYGICFLLGHRKPRGDPILSNILVFENHNIPTLTLTAVVGSMHFISLNVCLCVRLFTFWGTM